ncbi:hypothetical protein PC116_g21519 [Phytophthora cactorum]|nr:hypothetical protein PC123_g25157 [Phytophthora cactorum]KAG4230176.1 hypothetical protein PC116_g21519 [Phytophthora cactorum]
MCGTTKDTSGGERRDTGIGYRELSDRDHLSRDRWSKIADHRTKNEITERRTRSPNAERDRRTKNEIAER